MSGNFSRSYGFSKIKTEADEIGKSLDKINHDFESFYKVVELGRFPSFYKSNSLPNVSVLDAFKKEIIISSKLDDVEDHGSSFVHLDSSKSMNKANFYNRMKNNFFSSFKKPRKINFDKKDKKLTEKKNEPRPVLSCDSSTSINKDTDFERGATILSGKSYYYHNGVYTDDSKNKYQMSFPRTSTQTSHNQSEIVTIALPELTMIPIRKDSHASRLKEISKLPSIISKHDDKKDKEKEKKYKKKAKKQRRMNNNIDAGSSSLNMSSDSSVITTEETNTSSLESINGSRSASTPSIIITGEDSEQYQLQQHPTLVAVTATNTLETAATRTATIIISNGEHGTTQNTVTELFPRSSTASVSSSASSYCSILQSPIHLYKRVQSAGF